MTTFESEAAISAQSAINRARRPACSSDACAQGKRDCPTKAACGLPIDPDDDGLADMLAAGIVTVIAVIAIVAVVAAMYSGVKP